MNIYNQEKKFYVYQYLRSKKSNFGNIGTPYYIGKGIRYRAFYKHTSIAIPKDRSKIQIICEKMNEADAFQLEMLLIHFYGRIDIQTGILRNLTDGGEGNFGLRKNQQTKQKISASLTGKSRPAEVIKNIANGKRGKPNLKYRRPKTLQEKKNIAIGNTGLIWITNDIIQTKIKPSAFPSYQSHGFRKGRKTRCLTPNSTKALKF